VTCPVEFLLQLRRQFAISRRIIFANRADVARLEVAVSGTMIIAVIIIIVRPVLLPVILVLMPVLGPNGSTEKEAA
jgi:hypothetical protein